MLRINCSLLVSLLGLSLSACGDSTEPKRPDDSTSDSDSDDRFATGDDESPSDNDSTDDGNDDDFPANDDSMPPGSGNALDGGALALDGGASSVSAGDAGSATDNMPDTPPAMLGDFAILCSDTNDGQVNTPQFSYDLYLVNKTEQDVPLNQLSLRYFFTEDESAAEGHAVFIDYAGPDMGGQGNIQSEVGAYEPAEPSADTFVELSFGDAQCQGNPCVLQATPDSEPDLNARIIKLRVQIQPTALRYDLSNDYSYTPDADGTSACGNMVLYRNDQILFGVEPDGSTVAEPATPDAGAPEADSGPGLMPDAAPDASAGGLGDAGVN